MSTGILWHNSLTGEIRPWFMTGSRLDSSASVIGDNGSAAAIGEPFHVVAATDLNADSNASILWYNSNTGESQIWFMDREWFADRASVVDEDGEPALVGPPFRIVGVGDFNNNGAADILWYNSATGESQIWFMNRQRRNGRATVVGEDGQPALVGPPFRIVGVGDFNGNGGADILWYNSSTGESQIWFMDQHRLVGRSTVVGEDSQPALVGPPFRIVGVASFDKAGRTQSPVMDFTFDTSITAQNRDRLIARHLFALARGRTCGNLKAPERAALLRAYEKHIHHTTNTTPKVNASATINGSAISVNFGVLFPQGDEEISQTLIHEMMHCAGYEHPDRRDPPTGQTYDPKDYDTPNDNGQYYGTPPLRAEFCIAGDQSDKSLVSRIEGKTSRDACTIDANGLATIHTETTVS